MRGNDSVYYKDLMVISFLIIKIRYDIERF